MVTSQFLGNLAADPVSPSEGDTWFNTTESQQKMFNGTRIVLLG